MLLANDGRSTILDAGEVISIREDDEGQALIALAGDREHEYAVDGAVAEVAAKLGIRPEGGGGEQAAGPETPPAADAPVPLEVGQVWESRGGDNICAITGIDRGVVSRKVVRGRSVGDEFRLAEDDFRVHWPRLISPAPTPEPPIPSRDEQVAMLADGKRLRYVRDADGLDLPGECDAMTTDRLHDTYSGLLLANGLIASAGRCTSRGIAAESLARLASRLGYRFDRVVTD